MSRDFDIKGIIKKLQESRIIFTSEADFQLELAQIIKERYKDNTNIKVRLEYCPEFNLNMHIDILVIFYDKWIPIELKYKTKKYRYIDTDGCIYNLKEQSAHDCGCYDYLKDISRIEYIRDNIGEKFDKGYTIFITNDSHYKKGCNEGAKYAAFSLKDNTEKEINTELKWKNTENISTERKKPIALKSKYEIKWDKITNGPFSTLEEKEEYKNAKVFHILVNEIKNNQ